MKRMDKSTGQESVNIQFYIFNSLYKAMFRNRKGQCGTETSKSPMEYKANEL